MSTRIVQRFNSNCNSQDSDSVGRAGPLPPPSDTDNVVAALDKAVLLAKRNRKLDPLINVLGPVGQSGLRIVERNDPAVKLHLTSGIMEPGHS